MGQTKVVDFNHGVELSERLLDQLEGRPSRPSRSLRGSVLPAQAAASPSAEDAAKLLEQDSGLRGAYERSRMAGELLLKSETGELEQVGRFADGLLSKHHRTSSRPPACGSEEEEVLRCYQSHMKDALTCAPLVDAYVSCASKAHRQPRQP